LWLVGLTVQLFKHPPVARVIVVFAYVAVTGEHASAPPLRSAAMNLLVASLAAAYSVDGNALIEEDGNACGN